jgi:hypothetical protein
MGLIFRILPLLQENMRLEPWMQEAASVAGGEGVRVECL